jgi:hypothetical protein
MLLSSILVVLIEGANQNPFNQTHQYKYFHLKTAAQPACFTILDGG